MLQPGTVQALRFAALTWLVACGVNSAVQAAAAATDPAPTNAGVVPFEFVSGRILLTSRVNDSQPALVMLDTGYSISMLSREMAESLELLYQRQVRLLGLVFNAVRPTSLDYYYYYKYHEYYNYPTAAAGAGQKVKA